MKTQILLFFFFSFFAINLYAESSEELFEKGIKSLEQRKFREAVSIFDKLAKKHPENSDVILNRGIAYLYLNEFELAAEDMTKVIKAQPKNANAYNFRGLINTYLAKPDEAINDLNNAIKYDNTFAEAYINRGNLYNMMEKTEEALKDYNTAEKYTKSNPILYFRRAQIYHKLRKYQNAVNDFSKSIKLGYNDQPIYAERGNSYYKLRQYQKAIDDYTKALELNPEDIKTLNNRAVAYFELGDKEKAEQDKILFEKKLYDKYKPIEEINFVEHTDNNDNVQFLVPENWHVLNTKSTQDESEMYITLNDLKKDGFYDVGGIFMLIKNVSAKYGVKSEDELLEYWRKKREEEADSFTSYGYIQKRTFPVNTHAAELNTVKVQYEDNSPEIILYEFVVTYDNNLVLAYFQSPPDDFEYYKQIYDKLINSIQYKFAY